MFSILVTVLALVGGTPEASPTNLVAQLGSARYAERESAARQLLELGPQALSALREARDAKDPEVRVRANALLDKIQSTLVVRPTLVRLDFDNQPIRDVIKTIADRSEMPLQLANEFSPMWNGVKLTLKEDRPVSFWDAVDRLRKAGELGFNSNFVVQNGNGPPRAGVQLFKSVANPALTPQPVCNNGPFRIAFGGHIHTRSIDWDNQNQNQIQFPNNQFVPRRNGIGGRMIDQGGAGGVNQGQPLVNDAFSFRIQIMAEPRLMISQNGQLKLVEAIDDAGNSLMPPGATNGNMVHNSGYYGYTGGNTLLQNGLLHYPEHPGKTIKTLRGTVPISVSSRKLDPTLISLAEAEGKTFRAGESSVIVHKANKPNPNPGQQGLYIDLTLRTSAPHHNNNMNGWQPTPNPQLQIEIVDAKGRPINWYTQNNSGTPGEWRVGIGIMPQPGNNNIGPPAQLRFFELIRGETEATFEFHDIPLP